MNEQTIITTRLKRKIRIYQISLFVAIVLAIAAPAFNVRGYILENMPELGFTSVHKEAPYKNEVKKIISTLRYSNLKRFAEDDTSVSIDFDERVWHLHNAHKFDSEGNVLLDDGRFGICGDLAAYTHNKIKDIFDEEYDIKYVYASESGFFLAREDTHIVLAITHKPSPFITRTYILDPSYRRYGRIDKFDDYKFISEEGELAFVKNKNTSVKFVANTQTPVYLKGKYLVGLFVEDSPEKFDKDNFSISIVASKKHHYASRYIYGIIIKDGKITIVKNRTLGLRIFKPKEIEKLHSTINRFFKDITGRDIKAM